MIYAPIVLFAYNRPEHIRQTVCTLRENDLASESELFIYSDGPKDDDLSKANVAEVRTFIKSISGFKKITIIEREENNGLAESIILGVTDIVNRYGKVIVLEDDLETSPDFLRFMNEALDTYYDNKQVMQISGHMFNVILDAENDGVFLPFTNSIGWATWKRAWDFFDPLMSGYEKIRDNEVIKYRFNLEETYNYTRMLEMQLEGKVDSWAIRWYLSVFINNGLVLYPVKSLIKHIGFDEKGTHATNVNTVYAQCCSRIYSSGISFPPVKLDFRSYDRVKLCLSSKLQSRRNRKIISAVKFLVTKLSNLLKA
jgi:GT2 family glycosyltransferase